MSQPDWDVIVIGGGVVGCAIVRRFALGGAKTVLLERGSDILSGASKANSAILHTGFDAPPGSIEVKCMQAGYEEYLKIHQRFNLPVLRTGALVVAWNEEQLNALPGIVAQAHQNGVTDVEVIAQSALRAREPELSPEALGAALVPGEMVIDPWSSPLAYLTQGKLAGAEARFFSEVIGGEFDGNSWDLQTNNGRISGKIVINCTGNQGDIVEKICQQPDFEIRPRKGQFLVYDKSAAGLINGIILPVPSNITKGVVLTKTIFGNLLLGPTAEEQENREEARVSEDKLVELIETGTKMLPGLKDHGVTATYAGLRPATRLKDYQIAANSEKNWIGVNGIRSTGLTGALGIAAYVEKLCHEKFENLGVRFDDSGRNVIWPQMPMLAQDQTRPYQSGDGSEIVCHCESVTKGEIERALTSDIPATSLGGLRRRTRVMMGRCNGFYCSANVAKITKGRLDIPLGRERKS
ncbi:MAG TPA: FAD/NAD(P)-binding oxidoreductase [Devosia sp.]|nr:FAD/NAD(P)-binding oxidoreductase [Devosia sp.]